MTSSELRAEARRSLTGNWGKAALLTLVYALITFVISFVLGFIPAIGSLISFVISLPIGYGFLVSIIKLKRGEQVGYTDFLTTAFSKDFGKIWAVFGNPILKLIIPLVLVVVFLMMMIFGGAGSAVGSAYGSSRAAGGFGSIAIIGVIGYIASLIYLVIKGYLYSLSYYIMYDNPDNTGKECVEQSEELMRGNRWRFFWLPITFIGWAILASFTLGIGYLWLMPYMMVALVCFYEDLAGNPSTYGVKKDPELRPISEIQAEVEAEAKKAEAEPVAEVKEEVVEEKPEAETVEEATEEVEEKKDEDKTEE